VYGRLTSLIIRHPWVSIVLVLAATAGFAVYLPRLHVSSDLMDFIPTYDDARVNLDLLEETFGTSNLTRIIVAREDHPDGIYNPGTLQVIAEITDWLRTRPEFETGRSSDLRAVGTVKNILASEDGMLVEPFMEQVPASREEALALREALEKNGTYVGVLVSADAKAAAIMVRQSAAGTHDRRRAYRLIRDHLDGLTAAGHPEQFYISGRPVVEGLFDYYIAGEAQRMMPLVLVMLALFLFISFRNLRGVLLPMAVIAGTEIWIFGFLGAWGHPVYSLTTIIPTLICSIAVADAIHILAKFEESARARPEADKRAVLLATMTEMGPPVFMTSLTTAIGFSAMTSSDLPPLSDFGVTISVGIVAAFLLTVVLMPAVLSLLPVPKRFRATAPSLHDSVLDYVLEQPTLVAGRHPRATICSIALLFAVAAAGMLRLTTDSAQVNQFRPGHHLRVADTFDNTHFAGSNILDVMIDAGSSQALKDPDFLRRIDRFQAGIEQSALVGDSFSIAELIKRMNRVMNEDRPDQETIPASRDLVAQYLLLYSISGDPGDFDDLVDYDYRYAHVFVFVNDSGTAAADEVVDRARVLAAGLFPGAGGSDPPVRFAGNAFTSARLESYVDESQLTTISICFPALLLLTWMMFGRFVLGLLAIVPVSLAIVGIYGLMGYLGLPTDIATTLLGGMSLGIGVDFAIHYLHKYRLCVAGGLDHRAATHETAATTGRALFYNALVLIGGFSVLLTARFYPQVKLGALVSATMFICYTATMLLFPAALRYVRIDAPSTTRTGRIHDAVDVDGERLPAR